MSVQSKRMTRSTHVSSTGIAVPVTADKNSECAMLNGTPIGPLRFPRNSTTAARDLTFGLLPRRGGS
jgi:hypothetical protein